MSDRVDALRVWLAARLETDAENLGVEFDAPRPGGQSNETVRFTAVRHDAPDAEPMRLVLRLQPTGNQIFERPDVLREFEVLARVGQASRVPVPEVLWAEPDPRLFGVPFFVMRAVAGTVPLARPSMHVTGWLPTLTSRQRRQVSTAGIEALAAVHEADWRRALADGPLDVERHAAALARYYRWVTQGRAFPVTDAAVEHLERLAPTVDGGPPVLLWGDARPGNIIYRGGSRDTGEITVAAVIDWELASVGPAGIDLGHWLFMDEFHAEAGGFERLDGYPDAAAVTSHYESVTGRTVADLGYFELRSALFMATTIIRQADLRVARGELSPDTGLGLGNVCTRYLARRLGLPEPELADDWLRHRGGAPAS